MPIAPYTQGAEAFDPDAFFAAWGSGIVSIPRDANFQTFITDAFHLPKTDKYVYRASAEVILPQVQSHINAGSANRLHEWYRNPDGSQKAAPPATDIEAYNAIFSPTTNTSKAITAFLANAKKDSLRHAIGSHLSALHQPPTSNLSITIPKLKSSKAHTNPYLDVWAWTNKTLEWAGPDADTSNTRISHAVLPVLYHHFGCVVPSYDALIIISHLSKGKQLIDLGSGNGYWTYMLRRLDKTLQVVPIDDQTSAWRTMWIPDTLHGDGIAWLQARDGAPDSVLLLVYPQVGADFTGKVIRAYRGDTIIVAGTQNANGYTGFADETIAAWMSREMPRFEKVVQIPLPSFAGKDEALFVFQASG